MGHSHAHSHENQSTYYVEQIFTIAACGAIAGVCILLYVQGGLFNILKSDQHLRVLFGGIGLLLLVLIRGISVWIAAGRTNAAGANHTHAEAHNHAHCDHDHDHAHHDHDHHDHANCDHDHDHSHCDHDHEPVAVGDAHEKFHDHEGHDHGAAPWRYALMILPVVLFLLGLPQAGGMNASNVKEYDGNINVGNSNAKGEDFNIGFGQLEQATRSRDVRDELAGTTVRLTGQYKGDRPDRFTLVRFKINCCAADSIPLKAVIMVDPKAGNFPINPDTYRNHWVQITGRLEFSKDTTTNDIIPVILLTPKKADDQDVVKMVPPDSNPWVN
jgi:hypothetical protein